MLHSILLSGVWIIYFWTCWVFSNYCL